MILKLNEFDYPILQIFFFEGDFFLIVQHFIYKLRSFNKSHKLVHFLIMNPLLRFEWKKVDQTKKELFKGWSRLN